MFKREGRPAPDQIEVIIGPRATFSGQLRCDGSVRLDGTVEGGLIETPANVLITVGARVMADIEAKTVSIAGAYKGVITADRVELLEGGRLWGTLNVRSFLLDEGAHFQGELNMQEEGGSEAMLVERPPAGKHIPVQQAGREPTRARLRRSEPLEPTDEHEPGPRSSDVAPRPPAESAPGPRQSGERAIGALQASAPGRSSAPTRPGGQPRQPRQD